MIKINKNMFAFFTDTGLTLKSREKTKTWAWQNDSDWIQANDAKGLNGFNIKFWAKKVYIKNLENIDKNLIDAIFSNALNK